MALRTLESHICTAATVGHRVWKAAHDGLLGLRMGTYAHAGLACLICVLAGQAGGDSSSQAAAPLLNLRGFSSPEGEPKNSGKRLRGN